MIEFATGLGGVSGIFRGIEGEPMRVVLLGLLPQL